MSAQSCAFGEAPRVSCTPGYVCGTAGVALTYPDAPAPELDLVTDWHAWIWFVDDISLPGIREVGDRAETNRRIARLRAFLPVLPQLTPVPETAAERAVADLWPRTAPAMSVSWRGRFTAAVSEFLRASLWEADNLGWDRFPDPIEHLEMRRRFGAARFSAALLERAVAAQIPQNVSHTLPFLTLLATLCDAADLSNDIVSYAKDHREGVEKNNVVSAVHRALGCPLHQAVDIVNQLLTGRVHTLEHTVATDLPQALNDLDADEPTRDRVRRYAQAIQTWLAGSYAWHEASGRYQDGARLGRLPGGPTGLGTSAARPRRPITANPSTAAQPRYNR